MLGLLTSTPVLYVCNVDEGSAATGNAYSPLVEARAREEGAGFVVNEEHPQFEELVGAFEARLPGFDGEWFRKVAFPAFETCETVLYRAATG